MYRIKRCKKRDAKSNDDGASWRQKRRGRQPKTGVRKIQVTLDDATISKGKKIGDGNLSHGVRIAVKET